MNQVLLRPRDEYPATLPPFRVTEEMHARALQVARDNNLTMSEVQRRAMSLFLDAVRPNGHNEAEAVAELEVTA